MCMNCGCGMPEDKHGNDANITASDLRRAGDANGQSMSDTIGHIQQAAADMGTTGGGGVNSGGWDTGLPSMGVSPDSLGSRD